MSFTTVNEYINSLDENAKQPVADFVNFMNKEFPGIVPKISFSMPMWWAGPKMYNGYVAVSAAKLHYSVHFLDESYISELKKVLPGCSFGKRCINIKYGDENSISVVKKYTLKYMDNLRLHTSI